MSIRHLAAPAAALLVLALASCNPGGDPDIGSIKVSVTTEGSIVDPDGYTIVVGDRVNEPIAINGNIVVNELAQGDYNARLSGLAPECFVVGANPVHVAVLAGQQADADFTVSCPGPGARVKLTTEVTGTDWDTDGYRIKIGTSPARLVPGRGTTTISVDAEGVSPIVITDLAPSCAVDPASPTTVTLVTNQETALTIKVTCASTTGTLRVAVVVTGEDVQKDGFLIRVDDKMVTLDAGNAATIERLSPGQHQVGFAPYGLAANCQLTGTAMRVVTVEAGLEALETFDAHCTALPHVVVSVSTTGVDLDTEYSLHFDSNDYWYTYTAYALTLPGTGTADQVVAPGTYYLSLTGIAPNCRLLSAPPGPITVAAVNVQLTFSIQCDRARQLALVTGEGSASEIAVASENSETVTLLTHNAVADSNPAWSPDGSRLAFASARDGNSEIYLMNADGSGVQRLTNNATADYQPAWAPDGSHIAFVSRRDGNPEIYTMDADGSNPVRLTNNIGLDLEPAWSPDGTRIVFASSPILTSPQIYIMNADGTGVTRIGTSGYPEASPAWSPSGAQIVFARGPAPNYSARIMNPDGSGLTDRNLNGIGPYVTWGADGRIAYTDLASCDPYYGCAGPLMGILSTNGDRTLFQWAGTEPTWRP